MLAIIEHFGRLMLDDPDRFDADRLIAAVTTLLGLVMAPAPEQR